ncbi:hypothetical protein BX600DRAFT_508085 [Xylariales sp. PMI_506]|nr:hypothetical protein BX600DRAFT_508085 [Xylariales sp. PMI_506]
MPTAEDQELLAQISRLENRINQHKAGNQQETFYPRSTYRAAPYPRGRGYRSRGYTPTYRNKTLVLNGQSRPASTGDAKATAPTATDSSWVTRTDRHLQLINSAVFEKDAQSRANAIEQTQRQKRFQREHMEKSRVMNFVNATSTTPSKHEITINGIRFQVTKQGSKLVRTPGDEHPPSSTPRVTSVGGVKFYRTKNGNLVRHGIAKAQRMATGIKKIEIPCRTFSWTGIVFSPTNQNHKDRAASRKLRCGSCSKGPRCRFVHDPSKVAICRDWLFKNDCPNGDGCDLSHETSEERTPLCMHFANGKCNNDSCPYVHVEHSQADPVCRDFGLYGYCAKGSKCPDRHVFECPDFSNTGVCKTEGCKLLHRVRASVLRKAGDEDLSSSDEEDQGHAEDIDSDEVEEFIGNDDPEGLDFDQDYIGF